MFSTQKHKLQIYCKESQQMLTKTLKKIKKTNKHEISKKQKQKGRNKVKKETSS